MQTSILALKTMKSCPFCEIYKNNSLEIIHKGKFAFSINDKYPHSKGHILIIPFRHVEDFFELHLDEMNDIIEVLRKVKSYIQDKYNPTGYNVRINIGKSAGQEIMHAHMHLIPRYS